MIQTTRGCVILETRSTIDCLFLSTDVSICSPRVEFSANLSLNSASGGNYNAISKEQFLLNYLQKSVKTPNTSSMYKRLQSSVRKGETSGSLVRRTNRPFQQTVSGSLHKFLEIFLSLPSQIFFNLLQLQRHYLFFENVLSRNLSIKMLSTSRKLHPASASFYSNTLMSTIFIIKKVNKKYQNCKTLNSDTSQ